MIAYVALSLVVVLALLNTAFADHVRKASGKFSAAEQKMHMNNLRKYFEEAGKAFLKPVLSSIPKSAPKVTVSSIPAVTRGIGSKVSLKDITFNPSGNESTIVPNLFFSGFAYSQTLTHPSSKLEKKKKRCRKNLDPNQVFVSNGLKLGCLGTIPNPGPEVSYGVGCKYDPQHRVYELAQFMWNGISNCSLNENGEMTAEPTTEQQFGLIDKCFASESTITKYSCGPKQWSGLTMAMFDLKDSSYNDCMNDVTDNAAEITEYGMNNCLDMQPDDKEWMSYSFLSCTPPTDTNKQFGIYGSTTTIGVYHNKGCRSDHLISTMERDSTEIFEFSGWYNLPIDSPPCYSKDERRIRLSCKNMNTHM